MGYYLYFIHHHVLYYKNHSQHQHQIPFRMVVAAINTNESNDELSIITEEDIELQGIWNTIITSSSILSNNKHDDDKNKNNNYYVTPSTSYSNEDSIQATNEMNDTSNMAMDDTMLSWKDVCTQDNVKDLPFCNMSLSINDRVYDYVYNRIPIDNQIHMMVNDATSYEPYHIPKYQWWSEGLHGSNQPCIKVIVYNDDDHNINSSINIKTIKEVLIKCATSFPCPSGIGTSFNNTLYEIIGTIIGKEGRAFFNTRMDHQYEFKDSYMGQGIDYWSPVVNLQRDPRWGRNQEVISEDPYHTSQYAIHYINGLQQNQFIKNDNNNNDIIQIAACCKHYIGNELELWYNYWRHNFTAIINDDDLMNYYIIPFKACIIDANVAGIMCSYNSVNGIPMCMNQYLLKDILRVKYQFNGYITSDCGAIEDIYKYHQYYNNPLDAVIASLNATTDLNCGILYSKYLYQAYMEQRITKNMIYESFTRLVTLQMKLGLFNNNKYDTIPYYHYNATHYIDTMEHQNLALQAAHQSIVLLQNKNHLLPLLLSKSMTSTSASGPTIAVLGPHYNATEVFLSSYHGERCYGDNVYDCIVTPYGAIQYANHDGITYGIAGCPLSDPTYHNESEHQYAIDLANKSDIVILMMGLDTSIEAEELDRINTTLPFTQTLFIASILNTISHKNIILVLLNGGSLSLGTRIINEIPTIIDIYYGGQSGSQALVDVLYGNYNPTGKLAATMYPPDYIHMIPLTDMRLKYGIGRTYMYYKGIPEFQFGHGLSYSNWIISYKSISYQKQKQYHDHVETNFRMIDNHVDIVKPIIISMTSLFDENSSKTQQQKIYDNDDTIITIQVNIQNIGPLLSGSQTILLFRIPSDDDNIMLYDMKRSLVCYNGTQNSLQVNESEVLTFHISIQTLFTRKESMMYNDLLFTTSSQYDNSDDDLNKLNMQVNEMDPTTATSTNVTIMAVAANYVNITITIPILFVYDSSNNNTITITET